MASGKKIYEEDTGDFVSPLECIVGDKKFLLPVIPPYRLAVGGSLPSKKGNHNTDAVILKAGDFSGVEAAKRCREVMSKPVIQYDMDAELPDPSETNNPGIAGLFAGAQNYSEK